MLLEKTTFYAAGWCPPKALGGTPTGAEELGYPLATELLTHFYHSEAVLHFRKWENTCPMVITSRKD